MDLHKRLKDIVDYEGFDDKDLAAKLGVSQSSFSNNIRGETSPNVKMIIKIANLYSNMNMRWLLTGEGSMWEGGEPVPKNEAGGAVHEPPTEYKSKRQEPAAADSVEQEFMVIAQRMFAEMTAMRAELQLLKRMVEKTDK